MKQWRMIEWAVAEEAEKRTIQVTRGMMGNMNRKAEG